MGKDRNKNTRPNIQLKKVDLATGVGIEVPESMQITNVEELIQNLKEDDARAKQINIKIDSLETFYKVFGEAIRSDSKLELKLADRISSFFMFKNKLLRKNSPIFEFCKEYGIRIFDINPDKVTSLREKLNKGTLSREDLIKSLEEDSIKFIVINKSKLRTIFDEHNLSKDVKKKIEELIDYKEKTIKVQKKDNKPPIKPVDKKQNQKENSISDKIEINKLDKKGIKQNKEIVDKYLMSVTKKYGRDAAILAFQQYYGDKGNISKVVIPNGNGSNKKHEFKGEARALKVLMAKYVEYALNFGKETDPAKIKNFYDLSPKERRLIEKIVSMYEEKVKNGMATEQIPEEIVQMFTAYIRNDDKSRKDDESMQIQGVTDKELIEIIVSSEIDNLMEKEKEIAQSKGEEPVIMKTIYEEKIDSFNNSSGNIRMSVARYVDGVTSLTDDNGKKSAKANIQANMSLLLNRLVNSVDDRNKTSISIIPNIDIEKLQKEFERVNSDDKTPQELLESSGDSKEETLNNLQEKLSKPFMLETIKFDKKLLPWEKTEVADKYLQRAATTYLKLKNMIEETRGNITKMKSNGENVEKHEKLVEQLISIYDKMMENGNDKLISQYIALSAAKNKLEKSPDNERRNREPKEDKEP